MGFGVGQSDSHDNCVTLGRSPYLSLHLSFFVCKMGTLPARGVVGTIWLA